MSITEYKDLVEKIFKEVRGNTRSSSKNTVSDMALKGIISAQCEFRSHELGYIDKIDKPMSFDDFAFDMKDLIESKQAYNQIVSYVEGVDSLQYVRNPGDLSIYWGDEEILEVNAWSLLSERNKDYREDPASYYIEASSIENMKEHLEAKKKEFSDYVNSIEEMISRHKIEGYRAGYNDEKFVGDNQDEPDEPEM